MNTKDQLIACMQDLEERIDPVVERGLWDSWTDFTAGKFTGEIFSPTRPGCSAAKVSWPAIRINEALEDFDRMAFQQFGACSKVLASGSGMVMNVRCNYGSSILPSLFGVKMYIMEDALNTLPTSVPLNDLDAIKRLLDVGIPDLRAGYGNRVFEMAERFLELTHRFPRISEWIPIYHPDLQGPLDACEVIWGSSIFYALYDHPDLVHQLLDLVTETYIQFMHAWMKLVPFRERVNPHWGLVHEGCLMLRADSAMNLSKAMYSQFSRPYDQRLMDEFGGGAIHFCGKGDHFISEMAKINGLRAINISQPHLNQMDVIFSNTVDLGINLIGLQIEAARVAIEAGRNLHSRVHCS